MVSLAALAESFRDIYKLMESGRGFICLADHIHCRDRHTHIEGQRNGLKLPSHEIMY